MLTTMAERFFVTAPLAPGPLVLQGDEAHHLATVCRLRPGDQVCLFDGSGWEYRARILGSERRRVELEVLDGTAPPRELPVRLVLACPLPKGDRGQFLIEKLTELGVAAYIPLRTRRSVVHPGTERGEKLRRHVIEASKQCGRNVLMRLEPLCAWDELCRRADLPARKLLAHPGTGAGPGQPTLQDTVIALGPEGGFTDDEIDRGRQAGWQVVDLGPRILRVETAALALAAQVSLTAGAERDRMG
jgi:16S rRNA (uracil1498-N3)-methyltransferase